jgi:two-component system, LytTR family, sensor kinase
MKLNRKKAYPIVTIFAMTGVAVRSLIFPEFGVFFHVLALASSLVFIPILFEGVLAIHHWFDRHLPTDIRLLRSNRRVALRIVLQILTCIVVFLGMGLGVLILFNDLLPPAVLSPMLSKVFLVTGFIANVLSSAAINLGLFGKEFFDRWKEELVNSERLRKERAEAQFENLKNQFNPHFLFNALTSLNSLITEDPRLASEFVQQLAKVYRYVLQSRDREYVSLATELSFVQNYIKLLQTRFQSALQVVVSIDDEARERLIVPVTLQALIENAIKHNIVNPQKPLCIKVSSMVVNEAWYLRVENTLQRKQLVESSNKQGLESLKTLYSCITPNVVRVLETAETFAVEVPML